MSVENYTVISKAVELRALYILVTITPERISALIIGKQKYNVGSFLSE